MPETEEDGIEAEKLRRLLVRRRVLADQLRASSQQQKDNRIFSAEVRNEAALAKTERSRQERAVWKP